MNLALNNNINDVLTNSTYFGFFLTLVVYYICLQIKNKTKISLLNPLLTSTAIIVAILVIGKIDYSTYKIGANYISVFLTPATVCLAVPLFKQISIVRKNILAMLVGVFSGVVANAIVIVGFVKIFGLSNEIATSVLPKSITTPIALGIVGELGGISSITILAVILSGIVGGVIAPTMLKLFKIKEPVAQGLACGTSAHATATAVALEMGELQGAVSGLAITVTGLMTVVVAPIVSNLFFC